RKQLQPALSRQIDIRQDQIEGFFFDQGRSVLGRVYIYNLITLSRNEIYQQRSQLGIVFHYQYLGFHKIENCCLNSYRSSKIFNVSSTWFIVTVDTIPRYFTRRCLLIERMASHIIKLGKVKPPSGGKTDMCERIFLLWDVIGIAKTRLTKLSLK